MPGANRASLCPHGWARCCGVARCAAGGERAPAERCRANGQPCQGEDVRVLGRAVTATAKWFCPPPRTIQPPGQTHPCVWTPMAHVPVPLPSCGGVVWGVGPNHGPAPHQPQLLSVGPSHRSLPQPNPLVASGGALGSRIQGASTHCPSPGSAAGTLERQQRQEQKQGHCAPAGSLPAPCLTPCSLP